MAADCGPKATCSLVDAEQKADVMRSHRMQKTDHNPNDGNNECLAGIPNGRESSSHLQRKMNNFASSYI